MLGADTFRIRLLRVKHPMQRCKGRDESPTFACVRPAEMSAGGSASPVLEASLSEARRLRGVHVDESRSFAGIPNYRDRKAAMWSAQWREQAAGKCRQRPS